MTRILVVDDSEDVRDTYEMLLTDEGYDVLRANDGAAGLHCVEHLRPDVVLLDMMMPDVDGLQFLARLPLECSGRLPPVIANSGFPAFREEALRRGAHTFLEKPVELDVLLAAVRAAARRAPLGAEAVKNNRADATAARQRAALATTELVADLPPTALHDFKGRLHALAQWLQHYYGFGATFIQVVRDDHLSVEAAYGAPPSRAEPDRRPRQLAYCDEVIDAGATLVLCDPLHHPLGHYASHPEIDAGWRFYAGVPLTTWSGVVVGTLSLRDDEPHVIHAEDMLLVAALGLHVAHALEEIADGVAPEDFVIDADALFAGEMLPLFVQVGVQRAARAGGVVGVSVVELAADGDAGKATRACYRGCGGAGLAVVHRSYAELALVEVGRDDDARQHLADAIDACRRAVAVRANGSAWCTVPPGAVEDDGRADSDLWARLLTLADQMRRAGTVEPPTLGWA